MNIRETARLLGLAASYDNRNITDNAVVAWQAALSDVDFADGQAAVVRHFRESTDYLMPAHVRRGAEDVDRERRRAERERLEAEQAIESAEARAFTADEIRRAAVVIAELREKLPPGDPAKLRGEHWLTTHAVGQLRDGSRVARPTAQPVPNPYFDPAAARRLVELNAAELPAAPDDAPDPDPAQEEPKP